MKTIKFTPTNAPLQRDERLIGGDAHPSLINKNRAKNIDNAIEMLLSEK